MFYLPGILNVFSYTLLLTSSTEYHSHFVQGSLQLEGPEIKKSPLIIIFLKNTFLPIRVVLFAFHQV